jgi:hypothetical protein
MATMDSLFSSSINLLRSKSWAGDVGLEVLKTSWFVPRAGSPKISGEILRTADQLCVNYNF